MRWRKKTKLVRAHIKHAARTRSIVVAFGRHILRFSISLWVLVEWESVGAGIAIYICGVVGQRISKREWVFGMLQPHVWLVGVREKKT